MKSNAGPTHRSFLGREIDMNKIVMNNEMSVAVGNMRVNARGDELGAGGQIIRKKEEVVARRSQVPSEIRTKQSATATELTTTGEAIENEAMETITSKKNKTK